MSSVEIFNRYKSIVDASATLLCRAIMHLLKPSDGYPTFSNAVIEERHKSWQADCRAMDAACGESRHSGKQGSLSMPAEDEEHKPCRQMAAVLIERDIYGEHNARHNLVSAIERIRANLSTCAHHPPSCACKTERRGYCKWTYENKDLVEALGKELDIKRRMDISEHSSMGGAHAPSSPHSFNCACGTCYNERVKNGTEEAYMAHLRSETDKILGMPPKLTKADRTSSFMPDDALLKELFKSVQGVEFDSKCPHSLPFYACMSCSH
jgi:hypothetical protein